MDRPSVALVTCRPDAGLSDDEDLRLALADSGEDALLDALVGSDIDAAMVAWDDPGADWSTHDVAVVRSTWDYTERLGDFVAWIDHASSMVDLRNPPEVLRANVHKRYLLDLASAGLDVVPTLLVQPDGTRLGDPPGDGPVVVKPAVDAGARGAGVHHDRDAVDRAIAVAREHGGALVQPLIPSITDRGEVSVIVIDGAVTHSVRKVAADDDWRVQSQHGGRVLAHEPSTAELRLVRSALEWVGADLLYARIDMVEHEGRPVIMELELVEPSLFLMRSGSAVDRMVAAIRRLLDAP